jgi:hypothetical protein
MYLRINNIRIISASFDFIVAAFAGLPRAKEWLMRAEDGEHVARLMDGDSTLRQNSKPSTMLGAVVIAQPIINLSRAVPELTNMYLNGEAISRLIAVPKASELKGLFNACQMHLISNADGTFRYYPRKTERIRFHVARQNSDVAFMHALYSTLLLSVVQMRPRLAMGANGETWGSPLCAYLLVQQLLHIVMRLEHLGIYDLMFKEELIDKIHQVSRFREEMEAHAHGTLEPGTEKPWIP